MATPAQIAAAEIAEWLSQAPGKLMNPDGHFGAQCVDVANQYGKDIFGIPWSRAIPPVVGAKDIMAADTEKYFVKVWNDPAAPDQLPPPGAVVVWAGNHLNQWGHVAIAVSATAKGVRVAQQDGFADPKVRVLHPDGVTSGYYSNKPAHYADLGWVNPGTGMVSGWLIPKPEMVKDTGAITRGFGPTPDQPAYDPTATVTPTGVMHGIDVASWQKGINLAAVSTDFVIIKVTGGTGYVNPEAKAQVNAARKAGRLVGLYHYAHEAGCPGTAKAEAEFFLRHALPLMNEHTNLVLDWEAETVIGTGGNTWAKTWLDRVRAATGARPWLYANLTALAAHPWPTVSRDYPLWLAWYGSTTTVHGYASDFTTPFQVPAGFRLLAWQYTQFGRVPGYAGNLDLNVFFGDAGTWRSYATGKAPAPVNPAVVAPQAVVPASNAGTAARVHIVAPGEYLSAIAARYNTTVAELQRLNSYIRDPEYLAVGDRITLPTSTPRVTQVIVDPGDSLSSIATQFKTTVARIIARNPGINPDLIHPGQVLNI